MNNIIQIIMQIIISVLSVIGILSCINYISEKIIGGCLRTEKSFFMKTDNTVYLVLNADKIGDKLEYYIRKIQDDIRNKRCIYISKIILYSENPECSQNENERDLYQNEIARICELLTVDYCNVIFVRGNLTDIRYL